MGEINELQLVETINLEKRKLISKVKCLPEELFVFQSKLHIWFYFYTMVLLAWSLLEKERTCKKYFSVWLFLDYRQCRRTTKVLRNAKKNERCCFTNSEMVLLLHLDRNLRFVGNF